MLTTAVAFFVYSMGETNVTLVTHWKTGKVFCRRKPAVRSLKMHTTERHKGEDGLMYERDVMFKHPMKCYGGKRLENSRKRVIAGKTEWKIARSEYCCVCGKLNRDHNKNQNGEPMIGLTCRTIGWVDVTG